MDSINEAHLKEPGLVVIDVAVSCSARGRLPDTKEGAPLFAPEERSGRTRRRPRPRGGPSEPTGAQTRNRPTIPSDASSAPTAEGSIGSLRRLPAGQGEGDWDRPWTGGPPLSG
ncbi:DUF6207 family protein [Streptomyces sp. NPDC048275]|uniref:DUF6207 family protein n=1 Tax=Streptomyces sp. NPDC048275 TaxID=3155629 RepID=UPI0033E3266C